MDDTKSLRPTAVNTAIILPANAPAIWGLPPRERVQRQLARMDTGHGTLLLRGDVVYDLSILKGVAAAPSVALIDADGNRLGAHVDAVHAAATKSWLETSGPLPGNIATVTPDGLGITYNSALRKRDVPRCYIVHTDNVRAIEWDLYKASYKGVTDFVTKYVWPVPAFHATKLCARFGLTPNMVTTASAVLMIAALLLFWRGDYGWGLAAAWVMTFLDTVDGKLARCTLTSSKWGNVFDHGIDLIHPPFWYLAWGMGLAKVGFGGLSWVTPGIWAIFIAYIAGRLCEGYFMRHYGFHVHIWRRFDSLFRLVVARRNPNMVMLSIAWLLGRPDIGLLLVVLWTVAAVPVHLVQIAQAETSRRRGTPIQSWLSR